MRAREGEREKRGRCIIEKNVDHEREEAEKGEKKKRRTLHVEKRMKKKKGKREDNFTLWKNDEEGERGREERENNFTMSKM